MDSRGAGSLGEITSNLEGDIGELRAMRDDGVELVGTVEDDHGTLRTTEPAVAERYGLQEYEEGAL